LILCENAHKGISISISNINVCVSLENIYLIYYMLG